MSLSGIFKFILGFLIAIALIVGGGVAVALYFVTKLTAPPPRPTFANDKPIATKPKPVPVATKPTSSPSPGTSPAASPTSPPPTAQPEATPTSPPPTAQPEATPTSPPTPKPLEPGQFRGKVTWRNGLIVRDGPGPDSNRVAGIAYNQQVVVLAQSDDKRWLKVRLEENNEEGWVKAGNVERVEGEQTEATNP